MKPVKIILPLLLLLLLFFLNGCGNASKPTQDNPNDQIPNADLPTENQSIPSTLNNIPVAKINVVPFSKDSNIVVLDGINSYDLDNDPLTFVWENEEKPTESTEIISDSKQSFNFYPQKIGDYKFSLVVKDKFDSSNKEYKTITIYTDKNTFVKNYDFADRDYANQVLEISSGGYIIVGSTYKSFSDENSFIIRTDNQGNVIWLQNFGGTLNDNAKSVVETSDGGFIVAGHMNSTQYFVGDGYITKFNANGVLIWGKTLGTSNKCFLEKIIRTKNGEILVTGKNNGVYIANLSEDGELLWEKDFNSLPYIIGNSLVEDSNGDILVCGSSNYYANAFVLKISSSGNLIWNKLYFSQYYYSSAYSIIEAQDRNYILGSEFDDHGFVSSVMKINSSGDILWERILPKTINGNSSRNCAYVFERADGSILFAGYSGSSIYLSALNNVGEILWDTNLGTNHKPYSIIEASDAGIVIAGWGNGEIFMIKTDSYGNTAPVLLEFPVVNFAKGSTFVFNTDDYVQDLSDDYYPKFGELTYKFSGLPDWISASQSSGFLSGYPPDNPGSDFKIHVLVTDKGGLSSESSFNLKNLEAAN